MGCETFVEYATFETCVNDGQDGPVSPDPSPAEPGIVQWRSLETFEWLDAAIIQEVVMRVKDLYLSGHVQEAKALVTPYVEILEMYLTQKVVTLYTNDRMSISSHYHDLKRMLFSIRRNLDYWGLPKGWAPNLNFDHYYNLLQGEVSKSVNILYLTYLFKHKWDEIIAKQGALEELRSITKDRIKSSIDRYIQAQYNIVELDRGMRELSSYQQIYQEYMKEMYKRYM